MSLPITITNAGLAELPSPDGAGTETVTITAIGVSATAITPNATMTTLPGELYRVTTISGSDISADTIHLVMQDSSANAYTMYSFALYLSDGTLFAIYGQSTPILTKTATSTAMLACDIVFQNAVATSIAFGNTNFINPPASQSSFGVVQLATLAEAEAGTDATDVLTPATALGALPTWLAPILAAYATLAALGAYVTTAALDAILAGYATLADLGAYATTAAMDAALGSYATLADVAADLAAYATTAAVNAEIAALFSSGSNANGFWDKRPNGAGGTIIEQRGIGAAIGTEGAVTITFPIPFTVLDSIVIGALAVIPSASGVFDVWMQLVSFTEETATFYMQWDGEGSTEGEVSGFHWTAKGN